MTFSSSSLLDIFRPKMNLYQSIALDLEHLLNTRACFSSLGQSLVISYGIPDFLGMNLDSPERRDLFLQKVGKAISHHEKRLQKVNVREEKKDTVDRTLYFLIEGYLKIKGHESDVIFYSSLNHQNQRFKVNLEGVLLAKN